MYGFTSKTIFASAIALIIGISIISVVLIRISYSNDEIRQYETIKMSHKNLQNHFDKTWKEIRDVAKVSDKYKDAFISAYKEMIESRNYGGEQIKLIFEDNPQFSDKMWDNLQKVISRNREQYMREQERFLAMKQNYYTTFRVFPASWLVKERDIEQFNIVLSTKTNETFESGVDDSEAF